MAGVLTRHRPRQRRDIQARCTCGIVNGDCEVDKETAPRCSGSVGLEDDFSVFVSRLRRSVCLAERSVILIIGFPSPVACCPSCLNVSTRR